MTTFEFSKISDLAGVYIARRGKLNCMALRLLDGGLCLYSPVAGLEKTHYDWLTKSGGVSALLAPNHYHNKGLKGHAEVFPNAPLICSKAAEPRLHKLTGLAFSPIEMLKELLAKGQEILEPDGLKTGEVWIEIQTDSDVVWIVTDAFSTEMLPPGDYADAPTLLGTFPRYGVSDASSFKRWVKKRIEVAAPTVLLPCHGSPVKSKKLSTQLVELLDEKL